MSKPVDVTPIPTDAQIFNAGTWKGKSLCMYGPDKFILMECYTKYKDVIKNMEIREDDVWILGPPRCGTTLTQEMVWLLENNLDFETAKKVNLAYRCPYLEHGALFPEELNDQLRKDLTKDGPFDYLNLEEVFKRPSPRTLKTHLTFSLLPDDLLKAKVVFVTREAKDAMVSQYHFMRLSKLINIDMNLEDFCERYIKGSSIFGPKFVSTKQAWSLRHHPNLLFLFYEDIIKDMSAAVRKVAKFLNKSYTDEQFDALLQHLSFENMKNNKAVQPEEFNKGYANEGREGFIRKGKSGSSKAVLSPELIAKIDKWIEENLADTDFRFK